jgi:tRNA-guanine family transglycosylase
MQVTTSKGMVRLPGYLPVTTFGTSYPMDGVIRPFLSRFADMLMVSYHYAQQMEGVPQELPMFIDSGGFAVLLQGAQIIEREDGLGFIRRTTEDGIDEITPEKVLALQEQHADWGSTLDFPIPPSIEDADERAKRLRLTLANAQWSLQSKSKDSLRVFGSVQGWDESSYLSCAKSLLSMGFRDLALGGFVPRTSDRALLLSITRGVRALMGSDDLLHIFGMGEATMVRSLYQAGASTVDSSSFARAAASGKRWDGEWGINNPSTLERAHAAIANFRYASTHAGAGHAEVLTEVAKTSALVDF